MVIAQYPRVSRLKSYPPNEFSSGSFYLAEGLLNLLPFFDVIPSHDFLHYA